jgi:hypothetical protein
MNFSVLSVSSLAQNNSLNYSENRTLNLFSFNKSSQNKSQNLFPGFLHDLGIIFTNPIANMSFVVLCLKIRELFRLDILEEKGNILDVSFNTD